MAFSTELLEEIGLTKAEINVYLALLELGSSTTGPIVEKSNASSSKIYEILEKLMQKGLVSYIIQSGTKYFEAADPKRILDYMQEKKKELEEKTQKIQQIIPELVLKQKLAKYRSQATIFKGIKGIQSAYEDIFNTLTIGQEYYVMGATTPSEPYFNFITHFHQRRAAKGIRVKILYSKAMQPLADAISNIPYTQIKFATQELLSSAFVIMYGNKTLISVATKRDFILFKIESEEVTESLKAHFKFLWNQKTQTFEGFEAATSFFRNILSDLKRGEEYFVINGNYGGNDKLGNFFASYHRERQQAGIKANLLFNQNIKPSASKLALQPCAVKFLPQEFKSPLQMTFYKHKLYISIWSKNPIGFLIEQKEVVEAMKAYFDVLWKTIK